jgi:hypothetical protein
MVVVADLHGDWEAYARCRDRFVELRASGQADWLLFAGDLIHREPGDGPDQSLDIVLDILALRDTYGDAIIALCGNHELPHLYGLVLGKGTTTYSSPFEKALSASGRRADVLKLFEALPFYVRTAAGVCVAHAGAFPGFADAADTLFSWDHSAVRAWADAQLDQAEREELRRGYTRLSGEESYAAMARDYLAVAGPDDPRFDDLLRGFLVTAHPHWRQLRSALFTRCEQEHGDQAYVHALNDMLGQLSGDYTPQCWMVAGHMRVDGGHLLVAERHLRLASAAHATPRGAGQYLLFDAGRPVGRVEELLVGLQNLFVRTA